MRIAYIFAWFFQINFCMSCLRPRYYHINKTIFRYGYFFRQSLFRIWDVGMCMLILRHFYRFAGRLTEWWMQCVIAGENLEECFLLRNLASNIKQNDLFFCSRLFSCIWRGMDRTHIVALAKNILRYTSTLAMHISIPNVNSCSLCGKEIYSALSPPYKEFTLASCGHIFHQKCLEKYLVNGEAQCPNKDCNRDIETFLSPDLFKEKDCKTNLQLLMKIPPPCRWIRKMQLLWMRMPM